MGNCMTQDMTQPQRMRRRVPDSEYEVKSLAEETRSVGTPATTRTESSVEPSPNGYPSDEEKDPEPKDPETKDPKASDGVPIEEPPPIKRVIDQDPEKDGAKGIFVGDGSLVLKDPDAALPPSTKADEKTTSVDKEKVSETPGKQEVDEPSDTDSMSSQASREAEPRALKLEKRQKNRTNNSTFKKSTSILLCMVGLLAGSILMNQSNKRRDIRSFLVQKKKLPLVECTGDDCQFLDWVNAHNGLCDLDRSKPVADVRHTLCPSYRSNSTLPSAPVCNFAAWLDDQNRNEECSLDVNERFVSLWSKYTSFDFTTKFKNWV